MTLELYFHPFSSFCWKALIALREKEVEFEPHVVDLGNERSRADFFAIWPIGKFPVLRDTDRGRTVAESSIIIEYIDGLKDGGPKLIPNDPGQALAVREWERILDNYVHVPMQKIVGDRLRPEGQGDAYGVEQARAQIDTACALIDRALDGGWLVGDEFTFADCAAAPALFYAEKVAPFRGRYPRLSAYFGRLLERPSVRQVIDEARFFRPYFPGAPEDGPWPDE